jgi:hypothetical protein
VQANAAGQQEQNEAGSGQGVLMVRGGVVTGRRCGGQHAFLLQPPGKGYAAFLLHGHLQACLSIFVQLKMIDKTICCDRYLIFFLYPRIPDLFGYVNKKNYQVF